MDGNMETQIHQIEKEAYCAAQRAFMAQSDLVTWDKSHFMAKLRYELRISDDELTEILSSLNADDEIKRIREWRRSIGVPADMPNPSRSMSTAGKRKRTEPDFNSDLAGSGQSLAANTHSAMASSNLMVGRRVMIWWPIDNTFYEAFISGYDPIQRRHCLVYDEGTTDETFEWLALDEIPPADILVGANPRDIPNGRIGNQLPEYIEIFDTATLDKEVERLFISSNPDPAAVELAKKKLKEQKQALVEAVSVLSIVTESDEEPFLHGKQ